MRPETAQSIFVDFARLSKTMRMKLPRGVAEVGKSFRNEIAPRQAFIRLRELTQAEAEIFFNPNVSLESSKFETIKDVKMNILNQEGGEEFRTLTASEAVKSFGGKEILAYYFSLLQLFYEHCGLPTERTRLRELSSKDRAFYTTSAFDFEVDTSLGWLELVACNYRTDYDLGNHSKYSKKDLQMVDGDRGKVLPHVIELSLGVDRSIFAIMDHFFIHEKDRDVLRLPPNISPYLAAIFPLLSKPELEAKAMTLYETMKLEEYNTFYDDSGAIGRRYRRMDEIGTPFCVTIDHQTLEDDTATVRERDSMSQSRTKLSEIPEKLRALRDSRKK
ncbi:MAG TPA: glycine--tRNA ligase [Nitrososphaerales archaeon]|nr:glycine--tRNA ligase [Nitrososphaerales archaeon]